MKILVIDDSKTARMFSIKCVQMALKSKEYDIVEADTGIKALEVMENEKIDIVLSDINMPEMSGFTLIKNMKRDAKLSKIPIVFITSLANDARLHNLKEMGATDVITKPTNPGALLKVFKKLGIIFENTSSDWGM